MTDSIADFLPRISKHRLPGLDLGDEFIYPNYAGRSILNIPSTVCQWLGVPSLGAEPLSEELLPDFWDNVRCVVLVLMDALALHRFLRWLADGTARPWDRLVSQGRLLPLTSITPSTTSAALASLWTGRSAAEHGIAGYELWMKEYGVVANTILHAPMTYKDDVGSLEKAGFDPLGYLNFPTLGSHLAEYGVKSCALQHVSIAHSGLSKMLLKDVEVNKFNTAADLWINLRHLLGKSGDRRLYAWVYWGVVDHFGHLYGPDDERTAAEFSLFSSAMERFFLERLDHSTRKDTLLVLTADHGQLCTPKNSHFEFSSHPALARRLHIYPTGENRLTYFYIRPGQTEAVREYLEKTWPNQLELMDPAYAVEKGLFGPGEPHPRLLDRLGDLIVAWKNDAYLWWAEKENHLFGRHGGLHPEEMLVPFLAARL